MPEGIASLHDDTATSGQIRIGPSVERNTMPFVAKNEYGFEVSSFECRDEYLTTGRMYAELRCVFCLAAYGEVNVYKSTKAKVAPHFRLADGAQHVGDCDGESLELVSTQLQKKKTCDVPEALVARRPPNVANGSHRAALTDRLTQTEVDHRRQNAVVDPGMFRNTSSVLRVLIEARYRVLRQCYDKARAAGLDNRTTASFISDTLLSHPLDLYGDALNYETAFLQAIVLKHDGGKRIYHAHLGAVTRTAETIEIRTGVPPGDKDKVSATVVLDLSQLTTGDLPSAHVQLLDDLATAANLGSMINWWAYGDMHTTPESSERQLLLNSLDHLYIEN